MLLVLEYNRSTGLSDWIIMFWLIILPNSLNMNYYQCDDFFRIESDQINCSKGNYVEINQVLAN